MRYITHNGETLCLIDWAKRTGISYSTLQTRLATGWTIAEALEPKRRGVATFAHNGENLTVAEWAKRSGIRRSLIYNRLKLGWSIADALSEPLRPRRKRGASK